MRLFLFFALAAAGCRTSGVDDQLRKDLEVLKKDVARVAARQESIEKDLSALRAERKSPAEKTSKAASEGAGAKDPVVAELKVPRLKVVKVKDEIPPQKPGRNEGAEPSSTAERPFGDSGPEVNEDSAVNLGVPAAIQGAIVREEGDPAKLYAKGLQQFNDGDCGNAVVTFEDFVRLNRAHPKAAQAVFYVADCYFKRQEYAIALSEFTRVAEQFGGSAQAPMALYKAGMCLKALKDIRGARIMFEKVKEVFAGQEAADLAGKELAKLK
ncbi:MAG: tetratricopeptide repeat protein [Deltaproteobacteria bacterium]|nr:tetratricopeptide repeat protein [Deltaproteobacteria bacterium]